MRRAPAIRRPRVRGGEEEPEADPAHAHDPRAERAERRAARRGEAYIDDMALVAERRRGGGRRVRPRPDAPAAADVAFVPPPVAVEELPPPYEAAAVVVAPHPMEGEVRDIRDDLRRMHEAMEEQHRRLDNRVSAMLIAPGQLGDRVRELEARAGAAGVAGVEAKVSALVEEVKDISIQHRELSAAVLREGDGFQRVVADLEAKMRQMVDACERFERSQHDMEQKRRDDAERWEREARDARAERERLTASIRAIDQRLDDRAVSPEDMRAEQKERERLATELSNTNDRLSQVMALATEDSRAFEREREERRRAMSRIKDRARNSEQQMSRRLEIVQGDLLTLTTTLGNITRDVNEQSGILLMYQRTISEEVKAAEERAKAWVEQCTEEIRQNLRREFSSISDIADFVAGRRHVLRDAGIVSRAERSQSREAAPPAQRRGMPRVSPANAPVLEPPTIEEVDDQLPSLEQPSQPRNIGAVVVEAMNPIANGLMERLQQSLDELRPAEGSQERPDLERMMGVVEETVRVVHERSTQSQRVMNAVLVQRGSAGAPIGSGFSGLLSRVDSYQAESLTRSDSVLRSVMREETAAAANRPQTPAVRAAEQRTRAAPSSFQTPLGQARRTEQEPIRAPDAPVRPQRQTISVPPAVPTTGPAPVGRRVYTYHAGESVRELFQQDTDADRGVDIVATSFHEFSDEDILRVRSTIGLDFPGRSWRTMHIQDVRVEYMTDVFSRKMEMANAPALISSANPSALEGMQMAYIPYTDTLDHIIGRRPTVVDATMIELRLLVVICRALIFQFVVLCVTLGAITPLCTEGRCTTRRGILTSFGMELRGLMAAMNNFGRNAREKPEQISQELRFCMLHCLTQEAVEHRCPHKNIMHMRVGYFMGRLFSRVVGVKDSMQGTRLVVPGPFAQHEGTQPFIVSADVYGVETPACDFGHVGDPEWLQVSIDSVFRMIHARTMDIIPESRRRELGHERTNKLVEHLTKALLKPDEDVYSCLNRVRDSATGGPFLPVVTEMTWSDVLPTRCTDSIPNRIVRLRENFLFHTGRGASMLGSGMTRSAIWAERIESLLRRARETPGMGELEMLDRILSRNRATMRSPPVSMQAQASYPPEAGAVAPNPMRSLSIGAHASYPPPASVPQFQVLPAGPTPPNPFAAFENRPNLLDISRLGSQPPGPGSTDIELRLYAFQQYVNMKKRNFAEREKREIRAEIHREEFSLLMTQLMAQLMAFRQGLDPSQSQRLRGLINSITESLTS